MTRYMETKARSVGEDGRIGYTWRFFPDEAKALDEMIAKSGYTDRTAWMREKVLHLAPLVRATKTEKPTKKAAGKKAAAKPAKKGKKTAAPAS